MSIEQSAKEVMSTFDVIKLKLNELIIKGVNSYNEDFFADLSELKENLKILNLNLIANLLEKFLHSLKVKNQKVIAQNILQIISITRLFESVMNIELIKKDLINYMENQNAQGSDK